MDRKYIYRFKSNNDRDSIWQSSYETPHLSTLEDNSEVTLNNYYNLKPGDDGYAWCYYNVTTTESATTLFNSISGITGKMIVDGDEVNVAATYQFPTTGIHIVRIKDDVSVGSRFYGCTNLVKYIFAPTSEENKTMGDSFFRNCTGLKEIHIPYYVTSNTVNGYCFSGCTSLEAIYNDGFLFNKNTLFLNCTNIRILKFKNVTTFGSTSGSVAPFGLNPFKLIEFDSHIEYIGSQAFYGQTATPDIIIPCNTPPEINANAFYGFNSGFRIWVPYSNDHSILEAYKVAIGFSSKANQIFELNLSGSI